MHMVQWHSLRGIREGKLPLKLNKNIVSARIGTNGESSIRIMTNGYTNKIISAYLIP